jgi:hypothetical protein
MSKFSITSIFDAALEKGIRIYRNRWVRLFIQLGVLGVCGLFLYRYSKEIIQVSHQLHIHFGRILLSLFILSIIYLFIGTTSWWCILKGLGESPRWITSAHIQLTSTLAKYVPGYIWQYVGKAVMSKETGINSYTFGTAMALELGQSLWIGIGIALLSFSNSNFFNLGGLEKFQKAAIPFGSLILLSSVLIAWNFSLIAPKGLKEKRFRPKFLVLSVVLIAFGWFLLSFSFWLLGTALTPQITGRDLQAFIYATSLSMVVSILVLFVPNGLGVREGVLVLSLGNVLSVPLAIVYATLTRLLVTICELSSAFIMSQVHRYAMRREKDGLK